jgi:hypothetical protein
MSSRAAHPQGRDPASGLMAIVVLALAAGAVLWFVLSRTQRAELAFVLLRANRGPLIASLVALVGAGIVVALVGRRRSRFLTSAVEAAHTEYARALTARERAAVALPAVVLSVVGLAVYGYLYASGVTRWFFLGMLAGPQLAALRGGLVLLTTVAPALLIPTYAVVLLNAAGVTRRLRARLQEEERGLVSDRRLPDPGDYQAESAKPVFLLGAREKRESRRFEPGVAIPSWVTFAAPSIFGGLVIFGRKGSGKTSLLLRMIEDAIRFRADDPEQKPALCVLDQKGDIADFIQAKAEQYGRGADLTRLGVGTEAKWNPFGGLGPASTALECRQVGFYMRCAMTAGTQASMEAAFWQDNADNLIFRSVHLLALAGESIGFGSVYQLITSANAGEGWRHELLTRAEYVLNLRETQGADVADQRQELRDTDRYFEEDFGKLDPKIRTTIISVVGNFHQKFMTAQYARSFGCPAGTPGHFEGFRDLIAKGKIFVLDVRTNEHGTIANALGVLVKLYYQAAVKTRDRYPGDRFQRTTMFVMDEAQACITPSSANTEGDDKYLEMSRSFKAIDVYATQQYASFTAAVGRDMAQRIIGSFNNMVVYRHNDPSLTEYLQKLVGQDDREERSVSVSESSSAAERNVLAAEGETARDRQVSRSVSVQKRERQVVENALFKTMSTFEALGLFDSPRGLCITHFFTKPHFVEPRTPHAEVLRRIEASR